MSTTDYTIVHSGDIDRAANEEISFDLPAQLEPSARSILAFVINSWAGGNATIDVTVNGHIAFTFTLDDSSIFGSFHCVVARNVLRHGANVLSFNVNADDYMALKLNEIVLWWQNKG